MLTTPADILSPMEMCNNYFKVQCKSANYIRAMSIY